MTISHCHIGRHSPQARSNYDPQDPKEQADCKREQRSNDRRQHHSDWDEVPARLA